MSSSSTRLPSRKAAARSRTAGSTTTTSKTQGDPHVCHDREVIGYHGGPAVHGAVASAAELEALHARVAATRWPDQELVRDHSQGPKLAVMRELARYWATEYDWRRCEAKPVRG
jgi:hypothetical protein